jgi:hypothetical protein
MLNAGLIAKAKKKANFLKFKINDNLEVTNDSMNVVLRKKEENSKFRPMTYYSSFDQPQLLDKILLFATKQELAEYLKESSRYSCHYELGLLKITLKPTSGEFCGTSSPL